VHDVERAPASRPRRKEIRAGGEEAVALAEASRGSRDARSDRWGLNRDGEGRGGLRRPAGLSRRLHSLGLYDGRCSGTHLDRGLDHWARET
jgi:hypothetical protein